MQIRFVAQKTMTGRTNTAIRNRFVMSLMDRLNLIAMMSLLAANSSTP